MSNIQPALPATLIHKYACAILTSAQRQGHTLERLCRAAEVPRQPYSSQQPLYSPEELGRISRHVRLLLDDEFCGMTRQRCKAGALFLIGELILPSYDLRTALGHLFRFYALINDGIKFDLVEQDDTCDIRVHLMEPDLCVDNFLAEWYLMLWQHFSSWLIGQEIPVLGTRFTHALDGAIDEYRQVFRGDCQFEQTENRLRFRASYLDQRLVRSTQELEQFWSTTRIDMSTDTKIHSTFEARLRGLLRDHFMETHEFFSMERVAAYHNLSTQSLRRRLDKEGSSFRKMKEDIRREVALTWLRDSSLPISEISRRCGFAESNGLSRAMKAWVSMSPSQYRESTQNK